MRRHPTPPGSASLPEVTTILSPVTTSETTSGTSSAGSPIAPYHRRQARNQRLALVATAFSLLALLFLSCLQFAFGAFRSVPYSEALANGLAVATLVWFGVVLVVPNRILPVVEPSLQRITRTIFTLVGSGLVLMVFAVSLPFGRLFGRRSAVRRHPQLLPWVQASEDWRRSTWTAKRSEATDSDRGTTWRVLELFARQRNWFLLVVAVVLLIVGSVLMLAHSSVVAPFLYTLF